MILIFGLYRYRPKRLGYRNDYCLYCRQQRRSEQVRTFNAIHLMGIPLIPLGYWTRWVCSACRHDPHTVRGGVRPPLKWAVLVLLLCGTVALWTTPANPADTKTAWGLRLGGAVACSVLLVHLIRTPKPPSLRQELAKVRPAGETVCPFCGAQMSFSTRCWCSKCGVVRYSATS